MSSLQKFHRRTNGGAGKLIGSESVPAGAGFYLGFAGDGTSYMYVAPKSTETALSWGSYGTARGTVSTTNGLANTNTLAGFGQAAHPAAYYCKNLTAGGYNTWYLPAQDELNTCWTNHLAIPFETANGYDIYTSYLCSTESTATNSVIQSFNTGDRQPYRKSADFLSIRAVRRSTI